MYLTSVQLCLKDNVPITSTAHEDRQDGESQQTLMQNPASKNVQSLAPRIPFQSISFFQLDHPWEIQKDKCGHVLIHNCDGGYSCHNATNEIDFTKLAVTYWPRKLNKKGGVKLI